MSSTRRPAQARRARIGRGSLVGLASTLAVLAHGAELRADPPVSSADHLPVPGRSITSNEDASATATNPANLPLMPGPELRWTWVSTQESSTLPSRGHAFDLAAPFWIFGSGLRVELVDPPRSAPSPYTSELQWVRWGFGARLGRQLSFGSSLGWSISDRPSLDGQFSASFGVTARPSSWLSLSHVLRDLNVPTSRDGTRAQRSWDSGLAIRPIVGLRTLELGAEARYFERSGEWVPRLTLGLDVPYVGRLRGDMAVFDLDSDFDDPSFVATAGLDVNLGPAQVSGGAVFGDAAGGGAAGYYAGAAIRGFREPGLPTARYVAQVDVDDTPGARAHVRLLRKLWRLADDDEVEAVLLKMSAEPSGSIAHAEELGDAIRTLRARGKKVACHLEDAKGRSLFACSQADRIAMNPAGGLRFSGLSSRYFYVGGVLDKLGVRADFVRIGAHKSAAEMFVGSEGTATSKRDHQEMVDLNEAVFLHDVGGGRRIPVSTLRKTIASGPFVAQEAREAGLVDALVYPDELERFMAELLGAPVLLVKDRLLDDAPTRWAAENGIAIVYLSGDMVDGESQYIPFVGLRLAGSRTIAKAFEDARRDPKVRAVVFRIETGGGSSLAADVILREVQLTAQVKPVVVSMGSTAASGGYYAAVGGKPIYANRTTVTGSIGIFYGKVDVSELLGKLGVTTEAFRSAPRADAESFFRPFTDDEREELGRKVKQFYDLFIARVAEGRGMKAAEVDAVARGRVWTGAQAKERGLVDRVGGLREAIDEACRLGGVSRGAPIAELPREDDSLLGFVLSAVGASAEAPAMSSMIPTPLLDVARVLVPFVVLDTTRPMARVEVYEELDVTALRFGRRGSE